MPNDHTGERGILPLLVTLILGMCQCSVSFGDELISGVTARATSEQVKGLFSAQNVCADRGLSDNGRGDGSRKLTTNGYAEGGNCWQSAYVARGADESPIIEFDLGKIETVEKFHVWNQNGAPHRGFKHVSVIVSGDGKVWRAIRQRFEFAKAPKSDDYLGEDYAFDPPVTARFIRFHCDATHRTGGQPDLAGLGKVRFYHSQVPQNAVSEKDQVHTLASVAIGSGFIDVTAAPYFAKGDGVADDTASIQRAIDDWQGQHRTIWLPAGTYLVTKSLRYKPGVGNGYNNVRGAGRERTTLRLQDATFTDAGTPQPVLPLGFNGREDGKGVHADWFNCNVADLTIDTGKENPGANGLQYYSNNVGSCRDVTIRSGDGTGVIGLDLGYADQNGPLLVKNVLADGFAIGLKTGATVNSQTLEHVTVLNASKVGFENHGQCLSIRGLKVTGPSPAFVSHFGVVALIDSELHGTGSAGGHPAITTGETLFARNIKTSGFKLAIENKRQKNNPTTNADGPNVSEWVSTPPLSLFETQTPRSLNLPIHEAPDVPADDPATWANVCCFRNLDDPDDSPSIQRAIDSGATTVYFPSGAQFFISRPIELHGPTRRIIGHFAGIHSVKTAKRDDAKDAAEETKPHLRIGDGPSPVVIVQDLIGELDIQHASKRTLVVKNGQGIGGTLNGGGDLFIENVVADWTFENGRVWARQFNNERLGTHILNKQATLWILGLKTERGGTLIETQSGGQTELIGGLSYTTNHGKLAPMFVSTDARVSYTIGEVCYSGEPYTQLVQETRKSETKLLKRGETPLRPSFLQGSEIPLFVGGTEPLTK